MEPGGGLVAYQDQLPALLVRRPLWSLVREQTLLVRRSAAGGQAVPCLVPKPKPKPSRRSSASRGARSPHISPYLATSPHISPHLPQEEFRIPWRKIFPRLGAEDFERAWKGIDQNGVLVLLSK